MQYMISDGNVSRYLFVYTAIKTANASLKPKYQPGVGHYGTVSGNGRAYLTACINPRGESTVTEQQFTQNRYTHDLRVDRIVPWILGRESLIDRRCLWTLMSTPLELSTPKTSPKSELVSLDKGVYNDLETAWFSWHQGWQSNFPNP
ncbi:MAG: cyanoexosortase A system-associated protein [Leptolyngbyaceae cyanobacterium RU_5_1]|nr:cyanoexosortase A system-associated protein [Leptolyngbyaceae cyanobacterium RU_5_1]